MTKLVYVKIIYFNWEIKIIKGKSYDHVNTYKKVDWIQHSFIKTIIRSAMKENLCMKFFLKIPIAYT